MSDDVLSYKNKQKSCIHVTDRSEEKIAIIEAYLKATQQLRDFAKADQDPKYTKVRLIF